MKGATWNRMHSQLQKTQGEFGPELRSEPRPGVCEYESFLAEMSLRFANLPASVVEGAIEEAQRLFCEHFGLERSTLCQHFEGAPDMLLLTHVYAGSGNPLTRTMIEKRLEPRLHAHVYWVLSSTQSETYVLDIKPLFPWVYTQLQRGKPVTISSLAELPEQAALDRRMLEQVGARSVVIMPLLGDGKLAGCLTFATVHTTRKWSETDVNRFRSVADLFTNALVRRKMDQALRDAETRYQMLYQTMRDAVVSVDLSGRIQDSNTSYQQLLGYTGAELMGMSHLDLTPERWHEVEKQIIRDQVLTCGYSEVYEKEYRRKDGTMFPAELRTILIPDAQNRPATMWAIVRDITQRKQAEQALQDAHAEMKRLRDRLQVETEYLKAEIKTTHAQGQTLGRSETIRKVLREVEQVAPAECPVLISGETGTGKELIAQEIHRLSLRKDRLMVLVNCAALPSALVESELFGRERGAYTGAMTSQIGRFEVANGSTIFLDEVGELSMEVQAKLLRVLQQGEFQRLGSPKTRKVDVRVIAATNRDLAEEVRKGRFREDLYYRLRVFPVHLSPLRERADDIPLLVFAFMEEFATRMGKKITRIPRRSMELLQAHSWPGNIRELRNVIEHSVILSDGDSLKLTSLGGAPTREAQSITLADAEKAHILRTLESTAWRIKGPHGAALRLGLQPSTLYSRMEKLGIPHRRQRNEMGL